MKFSLKILSLALLGLALSPSALAGVCVELDTERDNFSPDERRAVRSLVAGALEDEGLQISGGECETTYVISHVRLGNTVTVRMSDGTENRKMTINTVDDLPNAYSQMAHSLVTGTPLADSIDRQNVTLDQANPRRAAGDFITTLRFGGTAVVPPTALLPTFGMGLRVELDQWAVDVAGQFAFNSDGDQGMVSGHLNGLRFQHPTANHSSYLGAGLGYGMVGNNSDTGQGFEAHGILGYELLRASTIRMFGQLDAMLPVYTVGDAWEPYVILSFGVGYKPPPSSGNNFPWWALF